MGKFLDYHVDVCTKRRVRNLVLTEFMMMFVLQNVPPHRHLDHKQFL